MAQVVQKVIDVAGTIIGGVVGGVSAAFGGHDILHGAEKGAHEAVSLLDPGQAKIWAAEAAAGSGEAGDPNLPAQTTPGTTGTGTGTGKSADDWAQLATDRTQVAKERRAADLTQIGSMEAQLGQTILGEKVQETSAEGALSANAAARGLKMEGSPLMSLIAQEQRGAQAIQYTSQQGGAAISGAKTSAQAAYDLSLVNIKEQLTDLGADTTASWLTAFSQVAEFAAGQWVSGGGGGSSISGGTQSDYVDTGYGLA